MKLDIQELQMLDMLLKKTAHFINSDFKFNLVIYYKSSFWSGDFINLKEKPKHSNVNEILSNKDNSTHFCITENFINEGPINSVFFTPSKFIKDALSIDISNYTDITEASLYALLDFFVKKVKENDFSELVNLSRFKFEPFLHNAFNLETKLKFPFIRLNAYDSYEVISIIATKE